MMVLLFLVWVLLLLCRSMTRCRVAESFLRFGHRLLPRNELGAAQCVPVVRLLCRACVAVVVYGAACSGNLWDAHFGIICPWHTAPDSAMARRRTAATPALFVRTEQ